VGKTCGLPHSSVVAKIPHFIGVFHLSIQNGQNGQANGQTFLRTLSFFSLSLQTKKQNNWHST
jgi:hypothetical protein